jgi:hypothetical protein
MMAATEDRSFLSQRTEWNVRDSDATVLFSLASELTSGSREPSSSRRSVTSPEFILNTLLKKLLPYS